MQEIGTLDELVKIVEGLRREVLCGEAGENLPPEAEQYYLLALSALDSAQRYLVLANYKRMKGE